MIKQNDFVEIGYTAKVEGMIFDTTNEEVAKANNILDENVTYEPVVVCVGQGHIIKGLDKELVGKEVEKTYTVHIMPEEGFGKKNPKLLQLISTSKFLREGINPAPGLQVNVDGIFGIVKTVSGGRTIVDLNHPLAGKELDYEFKINRIIVDNKEKVKAMIKLKLGLKDFDVNVVDNNVEIIHKTEINDKLKSLFEEDVKKLVPEVKKVEFKTEADKKPEKKEQEKTKV